MSKLKFVCLRFPVFLFVHFYFFEKQPGPPNLVAVILLLQAFCPTSNPRVKRRKLAALFLETPRVQFSENPQPTYHLTSSFKITRQTKYRKYSRVLPAPAPFACGFPKVRLPSRTLFGYKRVSAVAIGLMTDPLMRPNMMRLAMGERVPRRRANRGTMC